MLFCFVIGAHKANPKWFNDDDDDSDGFLFTSATLFYKVSKRAITGSSLNPRFHSSPTRIRVESKTGSSCLVLELMGEDSLVKPSFSSVHVMDYV